ncbi:MAG: hypothetical protein EP344_15200 [Bacteroidetes bacterium]|nr:MAG: hypothetical protein EP344_15200 [Bacteroidota bacterium]
MEKQHRGIRTLNAIEQAFTLSNEAAPLSVTCVLQLSVAPAAAEVDAALAQLQQRYPLLQAGIIRRNGRYRFHRLEPLVPIPCRVLPGTGRKAWQPAATELINTRFDRSGPLMKCVYLPDPEVKKSELLVTFHHAIIDSISARLLLHELLCLLGGVALPAPGVWEHPVQFPRRFQGLRLAGRFGAFLLRQFQSEWQYGRSGAQAKIPDHGRNAILSIEYSPEFTRKLTLRLGRAGLSLNSVLLAVITQVVLQYKYEGQQVRWARAISFADLRAALEPPVPDDILGCYISMLRLELPVQPGQEVLSLATYLQKAIFRGGRRGEPFLMFRLSKYLVRMTLWLKRQRLGVAALSFMGTLNLDRTYGPVQLDHVQAFITNNQYGPEFSAFGKILFGALSLDFTYLPAETSPEQAANMVAAIKLKLEEIADGLYL